MIDPSDSAALDKLAADFRQVIELLSEEINEDFAEINWFTLKRGRDYV